jgi:hypothetical protein
MWPQLEALHYSTQNTLHGSWINILYQKGFNNPNPAVKKWILSNILGNEKQVSYSEDFVLGLS